MTAAASATGGRYVATAPIKAAVKGREVDILGKLGIDWRKGEHISCPYSDHDDLNPSWRFDNKTGRALCTCITERKSDGIFDIVMKVKRLDFEAAKIRVAEFIDRSDLIKVKGNGTGQKTDAASLLNPPAEGRDDSLVSIYLARRLGLDDPAAVPMPTTKAVGWGSLAYCDPPEKGGKPKVIASPPCTVFETVAADGRRHAHRIYLSAEGTGKAELGTLSNGKMRDPKKSARRLDGQPSTAGCCVVWGDVQTAAQEIAAEGIETAAAIAYAFAEEIARNEIAVVSAIYAGGIEAFAPWPAAKTVTVAADRDEAKQGAGFKRGEKAARRLAVRVLLEEQQQPSLQMTLPGAPGSNCDFLDLLLAEGIAGVRAAMLAAERIVLTDDETELIETTYPLPIMETMCIEYRPTRRNGVWIHKIALRENKDGEKEEVATPVCSPFGVVALLDIQDAGGKTDALRVRVQGRDGNPHVVDFECADLARVGASEIRARLKAAGLRVEQDGDNVALKLFNAANPKTVITAIRRPGWRSAFDSIFVTPGGEHV